MLKDSRIRMLVIVFVALFLGLSFTAPLVYAKGHGGNGGNASGPGSEPKGWDEGKKKGWNGGDEPPGLAKKHKNKKGQHKKGKKHKGNKEEEKENKDAEKNETEKN